MKNRNLATLPGLLKEEKTEPLFTRINPAPLDDTKETVCLIVKNLFSIEFNYTFGFCIELYKILSTKYNVILVGQEKFAKKLGINNVFHLNAKAVKKINKDLHRKADNPNSVEDNAKIISKHVKESLKDIYVSKVIFTDDKFNILPQKKYFDEYKELNNEWFDYVGNDKKEIEKRCKLIKEFNPKFDEHVNVLVMSIHHKNVIHKVVKEFCRKNQELEIYNFVIDPANYTFLYDDDTKTKVKKYYFAEDKRGTRDFEKFPISQLQHIVFEKSVFTNPENYSIPFKERENNLFFIGTILQNKGSRTKMWNKFLEKLQDEKSSYWIPLKTSGIFKTKKSEKSSYSANAIKKAKEKFTELFNSIKHHPLYKGHLLPKQIRETVKDFRFGLVLRCVSINDSLNFRPVFYTYLGILPLLDSGYDPEYLSIPKRLQDYLRVDSHEDIQERIDFFNSNPEIAENLLLELRELFEIDKWDNISKEELNRKVLQYF